MRSRTGPAGWLLAVALLLSAAMAGCAPDAPPEAEGTEASEAEVWAGFEAFVRAFAARDMETVLGTFTADAVVFDPSAPPGRFEGTDGIRSWAGGAFETFERIDITIEDARLRSEGPLAWVTAGYVFEGRAAAMPEPYVAEGYLTMLWTRDEAGVYRSPLFHASPFPPGEPGGP